MKEETGSHKDVVLPTESEITSDGSLEQGGCSKESREKTIIILLSFLYFNHLSIQGNKATETKYLLIVEENKDTLVK